MPLKTIKITDKVFYNCSDIETFGENLLDGITPDIYNSITGELPKIKSFAQDENNPFEICTNINYVSSHIDILADKVNIIFDLGVSRKIDTVFISSFFKSSINYSVAEFELYFSDKKEQLFNCDSLSVHEKGIDFWEKGSRNNSDWYYQAEGSARFFGIKILKANANDEIIRLENIGLYSKEYNEMVNFNRDNKLPKNLLKGLEPISITNDIAYDDSKCIVIDGNKQFDFELKVPRRIDKVWIVGKGELSVEFLGYTPIISNVKHNRKIYLFDNLRSPVLKNIEISVAGEGTIDIIGAYSAERKAEIDFSSVITDDFIGIGANILPMSFMPESMATGYNEAYWELEKCRIKAANLKAARIWFQPDWAIESFEGYKQCNYNFETEKMHSVYKYLDILKETNTEIEFNFGWKTSSYAQDWFTFNEIPSNFKKNSAPADLELFSAACADILYELIENRGYDNIKYLTFYNEPNYGGDSISSGEFLVPNCDRRDYWLKMLDLCRNKVENKGLNLKYWGCEITATDKLQINWLDWFAPKKVLDCFTVHSYNKNSKYQLVPGRAIAPEYFSLIKEKAMGTPIVLTEFAMGTPQMPTNWNLNYFQYLWEMCRAGISGAFLWSLNGIVITDPCGFAMRDIWAMWDAVQFDGAIKNVGESFYTLGLMTNYIPDHSQVVKTKMVTDNNDIRVTAFKKSDNYAVILETDEDNAERFIEIKLNEKINKKLYKYVYNKSQQINGNAILPQCVDTIFVEDSIKEVGPCNYEAIVYSTIPPVPQIELADCEVLLFAGQEYNLSAKVLNYDDEMEWEIIKVIGEDSYFTIEGKKVVVSGLAEIGCMCAIKVYCKNKPSVYGITIVKVV